MNVKRLFGSVVSGVKTAARAIVGAAKRSYAAVIVGSALVLGAVQTWAQTNAPGVADVEAMLDDGSSIFNKAAGIVMAVIGFGIIISFAVLVKKRR